MQLRTLSLSLLFLLAACVPADDSAGEHSGGGHTKGGDARELSLFDETDMASGELAFTIFSGEDIFTDYGVSHTKKMHLILVRDDLRHFSHVHPEMNDKGAWVVSYKAPAGGKYWVYADFVEANGAVHTIRFEQTYPGAAGESGLVKESTIREKTVDGLHVKLETGMNDHGSIFQYTVTDALGKPVKLESYLGALGHSVLINPSGGYIHTHPNDDENTLVFLVSDELQSDFYRIFTQFKSAGTVHTASFDWQP
ncbi:MAG TPA: hypothetical protein VI873_02215 [Candidatus Peribacteraceae bacterium]|nr:hypothetical protein [Candidatus Peribacteraceae bacterium]